MNAVDLSENSALWRCIRWWKTVFFHMIDIAVVNSFILFQLHQVENRDVEGVQRKAPCFCSKKYSVTASVTGMLRDLIEWHKSSTKSNVHMVSHGTVDIDTISYLCLYTKCRPKTYSSHNYKFLKTNATKNAYICSFFPCTLTH